MKILLYIDNLGPGGAQRQLTGLAEMLSMSGYEVLILAYHDWSFYTGILSDNVGYLCYEDHGNPFKRLLSLRKTVRDFAPNVILSYQRSPSLFACLLKMFRLYRGKLIVSERSLSTKCTFESKRQFFFYRFADKVIANSYAQLEYIRTNHPKIIKKSLAIPNFVDLNRFAPNDSRQRTRNNTIIVVASLREVKNPKRLIQAAIELKKKGYNFTIKWFGVKSRLVPYYKECNDLIKEANLSDSFLLLDQTTDIATEYKKVDFFCLPSLYEGTSNALCEAMASGLPVVCGNISDNARYVKDGQTGFLFDPTNVDSMIDAISKILLLSENEYIVFSSNCRKVAEQNWSNETFLNRYKQVINNL